MRAIDADKLMIDLKVEYAYAAMEIVDKQPTIDPVKHGKWEYDEDVKALYCGNCGVFAQPQRKTDYCPHCGAKMDKEG